MSSAEFYVKQVKVQVKVGQTHNASIRCMIWYFCGNHTYIFGL
jgi:hypothetical protein